MAHEQNNVLIVVFKSNFLPLVFTKKKLLDCIERLKKKSFLTRNNRRDKLILIARERLILPNQITRNYGLIDSFIHYRC